MKEFRGTFAIDGLEENLGRLFITRLGVILIVNISHIDFALSCGKVPFILILYVPGSFPEETNIVPEVEFTSIKSSV